MISGAMDTLVVPGLMNFEVANEYVRHCKVKSWGKETVSAMQGDMVCKGTVVTISPENKFPISPLWQIFFIFAGMASSLILYGMFSKSQLPRATLVAYFVPALFSLLVKHCHYFVFKLISSGQHGPIILFLFRRFISPSLLRKFCRHLCTEY